MMQEELDALQAQIRSLQALVSELLLINQKLRLEVEDLKQSRELASQPTGAPPRHYFDLMNRG
jgi:regulator of replication initiation timing